MAVTSSSFWEIPTNWPNAQTFRTSTTLIVNIAAKVIKQSFSSAEVHIATAMINVLAPCSLRPITIACARHDKRYAKIVLELLALGALFSKYGQVICFAVDLIQLIMNHCEKTSSVRQ
ncbi:hypothetical protein [Parachlamydia acanthamoebae]|uniref:Uncharacterized protein n=2 Tax=Parachlamydia acanthamoebae TaxID=83552 RepID=F8KXY4_PARAV|nr:hypothetical protein [Parachlamydia acanthamoebae]KIA78547.1 hypothetical protein DB43_DU00140 [Parachlamydia acanthamoebae]CCB85717.1 putative uncharacterized protein [Parachlamydia acanthamoebae UV-7]